MADSEDAWDHVHVKDLSEEEREEVWGDARGGNEVTPSDLVDYDLHSNVCYDLVKYVRSNTIRNEQQFVLVTLGYLTGFFEENEHFLSGVIIGTSSSGKTHLQQKVEDLFNVDFLYQATTGSDKSFIYDGDWDKCYTASLDELQKPGQEIIEFLKGVHGGDDEFVYKTTKGSVKDGFKADTIVRSSKPYWFLYAQYSPDFEMWNRLMKIPVHEAESKNRAVGAMAFDHDHIRLGGDIEYGFGFPEGTKALQAHIAEIERKVRTGELPGYVHLPTGDDYSWDVWDVMEPIFNHSRSESNRIYEMVSNLVRASALFNYQEREVEEIYHAQHGTRDAIIAEPQDVANILACREVLVSTTHNLDDKRWAICRAIDSRGGAEKEVEGFSAIIEYLKTSDAPLPPEDELENLLEDLANNYLIDIHPGAGQKGRDLYEFLGFDELGFARVPEYAEQFEATFDPISGRPFVEVHAELRNQLESRGDDMMAEAAETATTPSLSTGGSLSDFGATGHGIELEPHEEAVRQAMYDHLDGTRVRNMKSAPVEGLLGLTDPNDPESDLDYTGTILDPDSPVWKQPDKDDAWVQDADDAKREVRCAVRRLVKERVVRFAEVHERDDEGKPIDVEIAVLSEDEL